MGTQWFKGVCDTLLSTMTRWRDNLQRGEVHATRKFLTDTFIQVDRPVQWLHRVPFSINELTHLVRILKAEKPVFHPTNLFSSLLDDVKNPMRLRVNRNRIKDIGAGRFIIALVLVQEELDEIVRILEAVRSGEVTQDATTQQIMAEKQAAGKGLWQ